jgi:hypothetical protein
MNVHLMKQGTRVWRAPDVSKTDILKIVDIVVSFTSCFIASPSQFCYRMLISGDYQKSVL